MSGENELPVTSRAKRHSRTRNGCERCRAQHRKCDETKPQCSRCVGAGVSCQYVTRISFLGQNMTAMPVNVAPKELMHDMNTTRPIINFVNMGISDHETTSGTAMISGHEAKTQHSEAIYPNTHSQGQRYPDKAERTIIEPTRGEESFELSQNISELKEFSTWPMVGRSPLAAEEIPLLQSFIHIVAPSLDVYDKNDTFRHELTTLAMNCPCLLEKLLRLSAALTGHSSDLIRIRGVVSFRLRTDAVTPQTAIRLMGSFALDRALLFAEDSLDEWESGFYRDHIPPILTATHNMDGAQKRMWCSILALIARLEIAASLAHGNSSMTSRGILDHIQSYQSRSTDSVCRCFTASMDCLKLLSEVMELCLPTPYTRADRSSDESAFSSMNTIFASRWNKLLRKLLAWEKARPVELEEVYIVGSSEHTLPRIIYSGGGGISTNILYRTAIFLLLSKKPGSASGSERGHNTIENEEHMHPLFHLRWVCGIALNCKAGDSHCWDPCTIAAISILMPYITGLIQSTDMAGIKNSIKSSGWPVG